MLSSARHGFFGHSASMALTKPCPVNTCALNHFTLPTNAKWPDVEGQVLHCSVSPGDPGQENTVPPTAPVTLHI